MDMPEYLTSLNEQQLKAVQHEGAPLLILAGAGSGKTRVITTKIAYLLEYGKLDAHSILAVTFTNKAANEMQERVHKMAAGASGLLIRTFHSFGAWMLRRYGQGLGLNGNFSIYDDADVVDLLSTIRKGEGRSQLRRYAHWISRAKDYGLTPRDDLLSITVDPEFPLIYQHYSDRLQALGNLDFGDLIMKSQQLLSQCPDIKQKIHERFKVILVDEYQDSNVAQFLLLKELKGSDAYLCVVGDDDQSIYRFRGAEVKNILEFSKYFPGAQIIRLEENYRSTEPILSLASAVVSHNSGRLGKTLWTRKPGGNKPQMIFFEDYNREAEFCVRLIKKQGGAGTAILYRTNAQSMVFESVFTREGIAYKIVGSLRFYEREEVKDVLALLRFFYNPHDEVAFRRIINKPTRGLGVKSVDKICDNGGNLKTALGEKMELLGAKARQGALAFSEVLIGLDQEFQYLSLADFVKKCISQSGLYQYHKNQDMADGTKRREQNLSELVNAAVEYGGGLEGLSRFLEHIALDKARVAGRAETDDEAVVLITMHNTKGLEFERVIITGLEDGLFPGRSMDNEEDLEEERRIFYVSITRAKRELYLTSCRTRRIWGQLKRFYPSRFLKEFSPDLVEVEGLDSSAPMERDYPLGARVYHQEYGYGQVCKNWYNGKNYFVLVRFEGGDTAQFMPRFSSLQKMAADYWE